MSEQKRFMVDLGEDLNGEVLEIGEDIHFTSKRNIIAYIVKSFKEQRK